jgi:hypothetical protein
MPDPNGPADQPKQPRIYVRDGVFDGYGDDDPRHWTPEEKKAKGYVEPKPTDYELDTPLGQQYGDGFENDN